MKDFFFTIKLTENITGFILAQYVLLEGVSSYKANTGCKILKFLELFKMHRYLAGKSVVHIATDIPDLELSDNMTDSMQTVEGIGRNEQEDILGLPSPENIRKISTLLKQSIYFVNRQVLGRLDVIRQSFLALMTGEHQLVISRTGMAKSLLARQVFSCFEEARIFEKQLTKDTMPENLFGAYDIESMKKGKMIYNVEGSLVLSHFAFLDEIFDANDMLLRSLLSLLNEKKLINGEQVVDSTLQTVIAAANYIRITEVLEAVIDRFMYQSFLPESTDTYFQYSIDQVYQQQFGRVKRPERRLSLEELYLLKELVKSRRVVMPGYILFLKNYILNKYVEETRGVDPEKKDFTISARKNVKIQDTLRASALLDGRLEVQEKDLTNLYYAVCVVGRDEEKKRIRKITAAARNYFRQDREILENIFNAISIFSVIKKNSSSDLLQSDMSFQKIKKQIEQIVKTKTSVFKEYFGRLRHRVMSFSKDTYVLETFDMLDSVCELSIKDAKTIESRQIIAGFREDVFNEKRILRL